MNLKEANNDAHTLPFFGIIDWEKVMEALADINYTGDLTYEANGFYKTTGQELGCKTKACRALSPLSKTYGRNRKVSYK